MTLFAGEIERVSFPDGEIGGEDLVFVSIEVKVVSAVGGKEGVAPKLGTLVGVGDDDGEGGGDGADGVVGSDTEFEAGECGLSECCRMVSGRLGGKRSKTHAR